MKIVVFTCIREWINSTQPLTRTVLYEPLIKHVITEWDMNLCHFVKRETKCIRTKKCALTINTAFLEPQSVYMTTALPVPLVGHFLITREMMLLRVCMATSAVFVRFQSGLAGWIGWSQNRIATHIASELNTEGIGPKREPYGEVQLK